MAIKGALPVHHHVVFPSTCFVKGEVRASEDFEKRQAGAPDTQARDKATGLRLWEVTVIDGDPDARKGQSEITVKIAAEVQPVPPESLPGLGLRPVEFENLTVTAYIDQSGSRPKLAWAFRASGMRTGRLPQEARPETAAPDGKSSGATKPESGRAA